MDFFSHLMHLRPTEKDEGVCLRWKCPRCDGDRDYLLVVSEVGLSLVGLEFSKSGPMLDLRCSTCRFEVRVGPSERALLDQASKLTRFFLSGDLSRESYVARIEELPARFVKDLQALTQTWKCSKCGESNPSSFDLCWNCSSREYSGPVVPNEGEKLFPGLPRGGNPWE
jgi:hypothetical protein